MGKAEQIFARLGTRHGGATGDSADVKRDSGKSGNNGTNSKGTRVAYSGKTTVGASNPKPKTDPDNDKDDDAKAGSHGKRILAAIAAKDAEALEVAIKDCVDDAY